MESVFDTQEIIKSGSDGSRLSWRLSAVLLSWGFVLMLVLPTFGQISAEEHAEHHPGESQQKAMPGDQKGMMESMGPMMEGMGLPKAKELYPSLMEMPVLSPEKRTEVQHNAEELMTAGTGLLSEGLEELSQAIPERNYQQMQDATTKMQEGIGQFESGLTALRAIEEGKPPAEIATQWFKGQMNLPTPATLIKKTGIFGLPYFHFFIMASLVGFVIIVTWIYFFNMRRTSLLLQGLTGSVKPVEVRGEAAVGAAISAAESVRPPIAPVTGAKWSGKLRIGRIFQETPDVKTFRLMNPLGGAMPFNHLPGQFLTIAAPVPDNALVKRSYTIASSPTQHDYVEITVKYLKEGVVSGFLHERTIEGDLLDCSGPSGSFIFTGRECKCILLIGGGVGMTPLMSVLRYLTDRSWPGDIYLLYSCRSPQDIIFREELDYLQRRHRNLRAVITVSQAEETDYKGPKGRITKELIVQSVPNLASRYVHICGPVPMMEAVSNMLVDLGIPQNRIKREAFGPALGKPEPIIQKPEISPAAAAVMPSVTFSTSDKSAPLAQDETILDAADKIGVEIDNSCRTGICGTCRIKLLKGQVTMAVEDGLEPGDKEKGIILACQAKSKDNVVVEA